MYMRIGNNWDIILKEEFEKEYFIKLDEFLEKEYTEQTIYPKKENIYNALKLTDYNNVRVVIIGQDPYHEDGEAHGLAFSVLEGVKIPPSLRNIFKELNSDLGYGIPLSGDLTKWAKEGVLLINSVLTVREHKANSHKDKGWEKFTDAIIRKLNDRDKPVIFMLWGNYAKIKKKLINEDKHFVIESAHPSPLSAYNGFFGSKPFSKVNEILNSLNEKNINWKL